VTVSPFSIVERREVTAIRGVQCREFVCLTTLSVTNIIWRHLEDELNMSMAHWLDVAEKGKPKYRQENLSISHCHLMRNKSRKDITATCM